MFKQIAVAAVLAFVASSSFADGYRSTDQRYVGGDVGSSSFDAHSDSRHNSYGAYAGFEFVPNFALEVGLHRLGDFGACCHQMKIDQAAISLIVSLPLEDKFSVFGRVGYNKLNSTVSPGDGGAESTSGNLVGLGLSYRFSPTVSGRAEIQRPSSEWSNFSVGVMVNY